MRLLTKLEALDDCAKVNRLSLSVSRLFLPFDLYGSILPSGWDSRSPL